MRHRKILLARMNHGNRQIAANNGQSKQAGGTQTLSALSLPMTDCGISINCVLHAWRLARTRDKRSPSGPLQRATREYCIPSATRGWRQSSKLGTAVHIQSMSIDPPGGW
jgi:hypothetical protein